MRRSAFFLLLATLFTVGCATQPKTAKPRAGAGTVRTVRTTAYTQSEPGGWKDGNGGRLSCNGNIRSAAADWSRFPIGTKFQIIKTGETFIINDYGSALVGTNTIDIFKDSRRRMNEWGVRFVEIRIIEWGSRSRSLEILSPRTRHRHVAQMVAELRRQTPSMPAKFRRTES